MNMEQQPRPNDDSMMTRISNILTPPNKGTFLSLVDRYLDLNFSLEFPDMILFDKELYTGGLGVRHVDLFPNPVDHSCLEVELLDNTHMPFNTFGLLRQILTIDDSFIVRVNHKHTSYGSPERLRGF
jgi:hypothetical protein